MESGPLIAIFCNTFPPEGGGASNRIYNLAVLLRDAGYRVHVVCAMPNYPTGKIFPKYRGRLVVDEHIDGISVRRVWLSPSNTASALARSWSMLSFVLSLRIFAFRHIQKLQPALVIVSSPPLPMAAATVRHFRKRGFRVLLNVSDIWPLSAKALGALNRKKLYKRLEKIASKMYESADAITAQSNETLEHIRRHCKRMPPSFLYRNLPAQNGQLYLEAQGQKVKIVYPGLLGHAQGVLQLCMAIDFHRLGAELHIYGQGPELEALQLLAANNTRSIYIHEPIDPDEMALVLADADAMLIPLVAPIEGALPSKLFTALQMGLPVFFSGGGEGASIVAEHRLGWVSAPGDYDLIARQIAGLVSMSAQQLKEWRTEIRRVADQLFNKAIQDSRFVNFIQAAISNK